MSRGFINNRDMSFQRGGHYVIDDRTGFKVRARDTKVEWTGARVHKDEFETRHPQDFVRGRTDKQTVANPRPDGISVFMGPLVTEITADAVAGAQLLDVTSSVRFSPGDTIRLCLASGDMFRAIVAAVPDTTTLQIIQALPDAVTSGAKVVNETAIAPANIG